MEKQQESNVFPEARNCAVFPATIRDLQVELLRHSKDGRSDALFRVAIATDQFGSFVRHLTHDPKLNPTSRPHGTPATKVNDAGHLIVQVLTLVALSGVDTQEAINSALLNLREKDFIARRPQNCKEIRGITASVGKGLTVAKAWVTDGSTFPEGTWQERILVAAHPYADARLKQFVGIVTDHGGMNCHAAIIARENGIPCIVGTGDATTRIHTGDQIAMSPVDGSVIIVAKKEEVE